MLNKRSLNRCGKICSCEEKALSLLEKSKSIIYIMKKVLSAILLLMAISCAPIAAQSIIPQPKSYQKTNGETVITQNTSIGYSAVELKDAANYLADILRRSTGYKVPVNPKVGVIMLSLDGGLAAGEYSLDVTSEGIQIVGGDYRAVIYGIQTLRQLLPMEVEAFSVDGDIRWTVPCCHIMDAPRFSYRGIELDVSRHFYSKQEVEKLLDVMASYKLNKFHWHLTDDQGWRIEIKKYPKLTQVSGWRKYNNQDEGCLRRAEAEDNEDFLLPADKHKETKEGRLYGGFYTQKDIREIVEYARVRGIDIIPEIDMPGHMLAALENYKGVSCFDEIGWGKVFTSPVCPGKDSAMEFCKNVYAEIVQLFPYEYVHIGGDEVAKDNWKKCPDCQKRMKDHGLKTEEELQSWFIGEMEQFLNSKGKKMIGWNEILEGGISNTSTIMWWGSWVKDAPEQTVKHGNDLIYTPNTEFYLDYEEDNNSVRKIYNFDARRQFSDAEMEHVLGVQGNVWCENIPTEDRMFYMLATRMLAIAELGWTQETPKNYYAFENRMLEQLPRLLMRGVSYRMRGIDNLQQVNVFVGEGRYNVSTKDPNAVIRYTTDGSIPHGKSPKVDGDMVFKESTEVIYRLFRNDGKKGDMVRVSYRKENYSPAVEFTPQGNGLKAEWHEFPGIDCMKIAEAPLNGTYIIDDVKIPEGVNGNIGLIITGYIYVPEDGIYTFDQLSDDGSMLFVDDAVVVDMNKEQSPTTFIAQKALAKGYHHVKVLYFDHNGGSLTLKVKNQRGETLSPDEVYYY